MIENTPLFNRLVPYLIRRASMTPMRQTGSATPAVRFEFANVPGALRYEALQATAACVHCGASISPYRVRNADALRGDPNDFPAGQLYISLTCPGKQNPGCARGKEITAVYKRVLGYVLGQVAA